MFNIQIMNAKEIIFNRLLEAAKEIEGIGSQAELARYLNLPDQNITNWKARGVPKNIIIELSEKWRMRIKWLNSGEGEMIERQQYDAPMFSHSVPQDIASYNTQSIELENNPEYPSIRRVNLKLSAGIAGYTIDYDVEDKTPIVMRKEWFEKRGYIPSKLLATQARGFSMIPGINDSDTVVLNTIDVTPKDGIVYAVNYEGELIIKRLIRDAGVWWLSSDNPDQRRYPRKQCDGDLCIILGKIVHKQSEVI